MTFGERLHDRRKELGLTLKDISIELGVNEATVQRYESGKIGMPRRAALIKLARALNVDLNYLIGEASPDTRPMQPKKDLMRVSDFEGFMVRSYQLMSNDVRRGVRALFMEHERLEFKLKQAEQHIESLETFLHAAGYEDEWDEYKATDDAYQFWCVDSSTPDEDSLPPMVSRKSKNGNQDEG